MAVLAQFSLGPEIPGAQPNSLGLGVGMGNKKPWALRWKLGKFLELVLGIRLFTGKYFLANSHTFCRMHILVSYWVLIWLSEFEHGTARNVWIREKGVATNHCFGRKSAKQHAAQLCFHNLDAA